MERTSKAFAIVDQFAATASAFILGFVVLVAPDCEERCENNKPAVHQAK